MVDRLTKEQRSRNMAAIKSKDTRPEIAVRKFLHSKGLRFRVQGSKLPGKPDIVLAKWRTVIFVNGCFWHRHKGCNLASIPDTNAQKWEEKFKQNIARDNRNYIELSRLSWKTIIIWECDVRKGGYKKWLIDEITGASTSKV